MLGRILLWVPECEQYSQKCIFCYFFIKRFFILKFLQHNNDFKVSVRKHSELSFDALFTKIGQRAAEKLHLKPTLILHVLLDLDWTQSASQSVLAYS